MGHTYTEQVTLERHVCPECGITHGVPEEWVARRRDGTWGNARSLFCPNGHEAVWGGETDAQRLAKQLIARQAELDRVRADRDAKDKAIVAMKGQATKLKKRISAGTCPCCKRSFTRLYDHMRKQHPEFASEAHA